MSSLTAVVAGLPTLGAALRGTGQFAAVWDVASTAQLRDLLTSGTLSRGANDKVFFFADSTPVDTNQSLPFLIGKLAAMGTPVIVVATGPGGRGLVEQCPGAGLLEGPLKLNQVLGAISGHRGLPQLTPVADNVDVPFGAVAAAPLANPFAGAPAPNPFAAAAPVAAPPSPVAAPAPNPFAAAPAPVMPTTEEVAPAPMGARAPAPVAGSGFASQPAVAPVVAEPPAGHPGPAGTFPFGQTPTEPVASPFGQAPTQQSPFGQAPAPVSEPQPAAASPFGAAPTPASPQPVTPFSAPATASPFEHAPAQPTTASPFGQAQAQPTTASPFGQPPTTPFGSAPAQPAASPFGPARVTPRLQEPDPGHQSPFGAGISAQPSPFGGVAARPSAPVADKPQRRGYVVTIAAPKGGTGKSTMTLNLAAYLGLRLRGTGRNVCLIDANVQQADAGKYLGDYFPNVEGVLKDPSAMHPDRINDFLLHKPQYNLSALLGPDSPEGANPLYYTGKRYAEILEALRPNYDYILIDTPVAELYHDMFRDFALPKANFIAVVITPNVTTLMNTDMWLRQVVAPIGADGMGVDPAQIGLVLNRAEDDIGIDEQEVRRELGAWRFLASVPETKAWKRCNNENQLVATHNYHELNEAFSAVLEAATGEPLLSTGTALPPQGKARKRWFGGKK